MFNLVLLCLFLYGLYRFVLAIQKVGKELLDQGDITITRSQTPDEVRAAAAYYWQLLDDIEMFDDDDGDKVDFETYRAMVRHLTESRHRKPK